MQVPVHSVLVSSWPPPLDLCMRSSLPLQLVGQARVGSRWGQALVGAINGVKSDFKGPKQQWPLAQLSRLVMLASLDFNRPVH